MTGWAYEHDYYGYFGINVGDLDVPNYRFFIALITQVDWSWNHAAILGSLILVCFGLAIFGDRAKNRFVILVIGVAFLTLFWLGYLLAAGNAKVAAQRDLAQTDDNQLPRIAIEFADTHRFARGDIEDEVKSQYLRLLVATKDRLYVYIPISLSLPKAYVGVVAIDRSKVLAYSLETRIK